jgi:PP-loop superfamily ATP-utilizing enzyme
MSGGTGSALVAYLVASVFEDNTVACIGKSTSLSHSKLEQARYCADLLGLLPSSSPAFSASKEMKHICLGLSDDLSSIV